MVFKARYVFQSFETGYSCLDITFKFVNESKLLNESMTVFSA